MAHNVQIARYGRFPCVAVAGENVFQDAHSPSQHASQ